MLEMIRSLADIINNFHDLILKICRFLGLNFTDKDLHFWIVGFLGIALYLVSDVFFKWIGRYSLSYISFIYTFTVLTVMVLSLEVEQKITGRGNMELKDILAGLWGFIVMFSIYLTLKTIFLFITKIFRPRDKD